MFSLAGFISTNLGMPNVGDTPGNRGQCVGLIERWLDVNGKLHVWGDAKDLLSNADVNVYHVFKNQPMNYPSTGSIVVWDGTWGSGHGHCAVVIGANVRHLAVFEQNNPTGSYPVVGNHDYTGVLGWLSW